MLDNENYRAGHFVNFDLAYPSNNGAIPGLVFVQFSARVPNS